MLKLTLLLAAARNWQSHLQWCVLGLFWGTEASKWGG